MTEMQKQFEEWAKSVSHNMASSERADLPYLSYETQIAYEAWQEAWTASRASIVVTLPETHNDWLGKQIVQHALQKEGIKYE